MVKDEAAKKKPTKQFVAHRHTRNYSSTRLANIGHHRGSRVAPLTGVGGVEDGSSSSLSSEDPRSRMKRSKSTDSVLLKKGKNLTPMKSIKSSTRLHRPSKHAHDSHHDGQHESPSGASGASGASKSSKKPVIQLEHDSDTDDDQEHHSKVEIEAIEERSQEVTPSQSPKIRPSMSKASSHDSLPPTLRPQAAPPTINNETVFATTQDGSNGNGFANQSPTKTDDANGNGTNKSRPSLNRTVSATATHTTRTQQKLWLQRESVGQQQHSSHLTPEQRKEFERITKEFVSVCKYTNPVADSVRRIINERLQRRQAPSQIPKRTYTDGLAMGLSQSLPKRINSLSATVMAANSSATSDSSNTWITPDPDDENPVTTASHNVDNVTYALSKLWNERWVDPDEPQTASPPSSSYTGADKKSGIHTQAQVAQQHLMHGARTRTGPNGGIRLG